MKRLPQGPFRPESLYSALFFLCTILLPQRSLAWGKSGHEIVAEIAMRSLKDEVKQRVLQYLGKTTPEEAAVWMDEMRSDHEYDFMKPWHYINIPEGKEYQASDEENILNEMTTAFRELKHKRTLCADQAQKDLMILFHLTGDLHQPLHDGYAADKGGNDIKVQFGSVASNLHWVWDDQIIQQQHISLQGCIALDNRLSADERKKITRIDFVQWMKEARSHLPEVYRFSGNKIDEAYGAEHKTLITQQLLYAGLRLGALLDALFAGEQEPLVVAGEKAATGPVSADEAKNYIGKEVTVCDKVYGGKYLDRSKGTPTFVNMGAPYPGSPFTIVIFGEERTLFDYKPEEYLDGKRVCVTGKVKEYKGKPEIVVSKPAQVQIK